MDLISRAEKKTMTSTTEFVLQVKRLLLSKSGQDLIEYALLAGFVAVAAGAIFPRTLMPGISTIFSKVGSILSQA
jgi:pilus assembly protein Flp/PilA